MIRATVIEHGNLNKRRTIILPSIENRSSGRLEVTADISVIVLDQWWGQTVQTY